MSIFTRKLKIRDCDVTPNRRLRPSCLFSMLQEIAIDHSEELGAGRSKTYDRGFLWVLARQRVELARLPEYGECVTLESWPGDTMHMLFPRYYRMLDGEGNTILSASSIWTLIDARKRTLISPQKEGILVSGEKTGYEIALPSGIRKQSAGITRSFTVPYSYTDLNGHMNNIRYLDEAENMIPEVASARRVCEIAVEYAHEILLGQSMELSLHSDGNTFTFSGDGEKHYFSLQMRYE